MDIKEELKKCYNMKLTIDSTQVKQELDEIESQLDRITEKYKKVIVLSNKKMDISQIYSNIEEILNYQLRDIKENIKVEMMKGCHGSENIKFTGSILEDTISMWEYARRTKDIYDKAYVMKSVLDNVLETYFKALNEIKLLES